MATERPNQLFRNMNAKVAAVPMIVTALFVFVGGTAWTIVYSRANQLGLRVKIFNVSVHFE